MSIPNVNIEVLYYFKLDILSNSSIYYPDKKENNDIFDICYLQQVKAKTYSQDGSDVGVIQILNSFGSDDKDGINTGIITLKTKNGIISWTNAYDVGTSIEPFVPADLIIFTKATFVSGIYAMNGLDVYIKIFRFDDSKLTRKIEIFY